MITMVIILSLLLTSGCRSVTIAAIDNHQIELEVRDAFKGLVKAAESLDSAAYLSFFDRDKFTGLNADGTVWHSLENLDALISAGFSMVQKNISLEFSHVKVTVINSTTAILVNQYQHSMLLNSGDIIKESGGGTQVWHKSNIGWKLVSVSSSIANPVK